MPSGATAMAWHAMPCGRSCATTAGGSALRPWSRLAVTQQYECVVAAAAVDPAGSGMPTAGMVKSVPDRNPMASRMVPVAGLMAMRL